MDYAVAMVIITICVLEGQAIDTHTGTLACMDSVRLVATTTQDVLDMEAIEDQLEADQLLL